MTTEQRLKRLERENRWMRRIGAVGVAVAAAVFLVGQGKEKVPPDLKVHSLIIVDKNGRRRAKLGTWDKKGGFPYLALLDSRGQNRLNLSVEADVPHLALNDRVGKPRVMLGMTPDGSAALRFVEDGWARAALGTSLGGRPWLTLHGEGGGLRAMFATKPDGSPSLTLHGEGGGLRAMFAMKPDGSPTLGLADKDGKVRVALSAHAPDGSPTLGLHDKDGKVRVVLSANPAGSAMGLMDKDGKVRAALETGADGSPGLKLSDAKGKLIWKAPKD